MVQKTCLDLTCFKIYATDSCLWFCKGNCTNLLPRRLCQQMQWKPNKETWMNVYFLAESLPRNIHVKSSIGLGFVCVTQTSWIIYSWGAYTDSEQRYNNKYQGVKKISLWSLVKPYARWDWIRHRSDWSELETLIWEDGTICDYLWSAITLSAILDINHNRIGGSMAAISIVFGDDYNLVRLTTCWSWWLA